MKTATSGMKTHIAGAETSLVGLVKITLTKYQPLISMITQSNPGVVITRGAHGYKDNDVVRIVNVRGMTQINRKEVSILKLSDTAFQIDVDTSGYSPYTGKGEARRVIAFTDYYQELCLTL